MVIRIRASQMLGRRKKDANFYGCCRWGRREGFFSSFSSCSGLTVKRSTLSFLVPEFEPSKSRNASLKWLIIQVNLSPLIRASKFDLREKIKNAKKMRTIKMHINPIILDYRCSLHVFRDSHAHIRVGFRLLCGCLGSCQRTQLEFQAVMYSSPHYDLIAKKLARLK